MGYYKRLVGEKCYLSPCCLEDAQTWACWFNDLEVTIPLGDEAFLPTGLENEQEATRLLLDHAFNLLNLNNVRLGTFSFNTRANACYRNVGFKEIGR